MAGNVLFITVDQWRGDSLSRLGHPLVRTPALDRLSERGVLFANHWSVTAPCGPSRASLYTGTYLHHHRSVLNGTPLDARFTNVALEARLAGYDPVLFGYTDTSVDPRTVAPDDPRLRTYEGVLPGFRPVVHDPFEAGGLEWGKWLAARGRDVPSNPRQLYEPDTSYPGASDHAPSWAPARFQRDETETAFMTEQVIRWLEGNGGGRFFVHVSYIRPHPPYRNPPGYHDLYAADDVPPFAAHPTREAERAMHPFNDLLLAVPAVATPEDEDERRQLRATYHAMQAEVDDQLGRLFGYLETAGLAGETLIVLTSDHGEMGGDHWAIQKAGYWDESFRVPLLVADPRSSSDASRGRVVTSFTESVDVMPTILEWIGAEIPLQADGLSLASWLEGDDAPADWRDAAHFEWDFRNPSAQLAEQLLGVPSAHCVLNVLRGAATKYVQFGTDRLAPLLFDLDADPNQLVDLSGDPAEVGRAYAAAEQLLRWRMSNDDRLLANTLLTADRGLVEHRDR